MWMSYCGCLAAILSVLSLQAAVAQEQAAEDGKLTVELNGAGNVGSDCRLTFVVTNRTTVELDDVSFTFALYEERDGKPSVDAKSGLFLFEFGSLPKGKNRVLQFDVKDKDCDIVTRISSNGAVDCQAGGVQDAICDKNLVQRRGATSVIFD
jgi:hypothetical protein